MKNIVLGALALVSTIVPSMVAAQSFSSKDIRNPAVAQVRCGTERGTVTILDNGTAITAFHVLHRADMMNVRCTVDSNPIWIKKVIDDLDVAVITFDMSGYASLPFSCASMETGATYTAFGYTEKRMVKSDLVARGNYIRLAVDGATSYQFKNTRMLNGPIFKGMSGGPVLDTDGRVNAIMIFYTGDSEQAGVREIKDTPLCEGSFDQGHLVVKD